MEREHQQRQTELSPIHDFASKLCQPSILDHVKNYVQWQVAWRQHRAQGKSLETFLDNPSLTVPISINLDLTTACNYACDHCVDFDILNKGVRYDHEKLKQSLTEMAHRGLKSVIVIGGGEPTVHPAFYDVICHMKELKLQVGIVTNGSMMHKIQEIATHLKPSDWVRLSLDSGSNETFEKMHKPRRKGVTLDSICEGVPLVKETSSSFPIGYSYIIVWQQCEANGAKIVENIHEMVMAAARAKKYQFDYIAYKPFLTRAQSTNAEIVGLTKQEYHLDAVMEEIKRQISFARELADDHFRVIESTNLKVLENGTFHEYTDQPRNCHMTFFRQVLSPLGLFNCPAYRYVEATTLGDKNAYTTPAQIESTRRATLQQIESFDAHEQCKEITCLYNNANWFIEDLIKHPEKLSTLKSTEERADFFL